MGLALGRKGANIRRIESSLNRKIKIVEFNPELKDFIRSIIFPLRVDDITDDGGIVTLITHDTKTRGLLIGRAAQNLRNYESLVKRYFDVRELKVASIQ